MIRDLATTASEMTLQLLGTFLILISLIGFLVHSTTSVYSIIEPDSPNKNLTNRTGGNLSYVQSKYPHAEVSKRSKSFPFKSTIVLIAGIYVFTRSRRIRGYEADSLNLLNTLKLHKKYRLHELSNRVGMDEQTIISKLITLNTQHGTSYSVNTEGVIVDNDSMVEWHLNTSCANCGAISNELVLIAIENESLSCAYCSSEIHDPAFEQFKAKRTNQSHKNETLYDGILRHVRAEKDYFVKYVKWCFSGKGKIQ